MKKICLTSFTCFVLFTTTANANWGPGNYSKGNENHAYGLVKQQTVGTSAFNLETTQGDYIPSIYAGAEFASNEMWVGKETTWWIEAGEISGPTDCCTRYRFYGVKYPNRPLYVHIDYEEGSIPLNKEELYGIIRCGQPQEDRWCIEFKGITVESFANLPIAFTEREIGIEIATESKPSAYGRAVGVDENLNPWPESEGPITYNMDSGICESGIEPGVCGFNRFYPYDEINWGFGNGPHDNFGLHEFVKVKRGARHGFAVPVKKGSHITGHVTLRRNKEGRINEIWLGKRPTIKEIVGKY